MFVMYYLTPAEEGMPTERVLVLGRNLPWSWQAVGVCGGGGAGVIIGSILTFVGVSLRWDAGGGGVRKRKRGKRRECAACGATNAPGTRKCYRCGQLL